MAPYSIWCFRYNVKGKFLKRVDQVETETCAKFKLRTSIHSKQLSCMHERKKSFETFRLIKMPSKNGKLNPQSLLTLLKCYAENSSIHGR